jgi:tetratricopeptide (TPR) repeat protein
MDKVETLTRAKELRQSDKLEESQDLLLALLEEYPQDPQVLFEVGGAYDVMGWENLAIPYYQDSINQGLEGPELQECLVCLGSSLRFIGEADEAVSTLLKATEQFPENNSGRAFLALAYFSNDQYEESVRLLLELLLDTTEDTGILAYEETLDFYKDNLDEVWEAEE